MDIHTHARTRNILYLFVENACVFSPQKIPILSWNWHVLRLRTYVNILAKFSGLNQFITSTKAAKKQNKTSRVIYT